jgi:hypothetical protein
MRNFYQSSAWCMIEDMRSLTSQERIVALEEL